MHFYIRIIGEKICKKFIIFHHHLKTYLFDLISDNVHPMYSSTDLLNEFDIFPLSFDTRLSLIFAQWKFSVLDGLVVCSQRM